MVNGNPLENLHLLNPFGTDVVIQDGKPISNYGPIVPGDPRIKIARGGGIEWTIKDGVPYSVLQEGAGTVTVGRDHLIGSRAVQCKVPPGWCYAT